MRQFDILDNPSIRSRAVAPYVVVLQSHHLAAIPTTAGFHGRLAHAVLPLALLHLEHDLHVRIEGATVHHMRLFTEKPQQQRSRHTREQATDVTFDALQHRKRLALRADRHRCRHGWRAHWRGTLPDRVHS